jgi:hypothetical protein
MTQKTNKTKKNKPKRIWFLRHCDKPPHLPCCSDIGYQRIHHWSDFFLKQQLQQLQPQQQQWQMVASSYHPQKKCTPYNIYPPSGKKGRHSCPKSQRMWLTASILQEDLLQRGLHMDPLLVDDFCVGQTKPLLQHILTSMTASDVIVVWEHHEILTMIHHLLERKQPHRWQQQYGKMYDAVILYDVHAKQAFYACWTLPNQSIP